LVVTRDIRKLVKLPAVRLWQRDRNRAIGRAFEIVATHREICFDGLAREAFSIDLDRVSALSRDDRSSRDSPIENRRDVSRYSTAVARGEGERLIDRDVGRTTDLDCRTDRLN